MRLRGFQFRVLVLSLGLVAAGVVATTLAALAASREHALATARRELQLGGKLFEELFNSRHDQLLSTVSVLARDFGFREAAATRDRATIESALANSRARVGASLAVMLDGDGGIVAADPGELGAPDTRRHMRELVEGAAKSDREAATAIIEGDAYQLVIVPVRAPLRIGWVCMGFEIDDELAGRLAELTGLDVSFWGHFEGGRGLLASMLEEDARARLVAHLSDAGSPAGLEPLRVADALTLEAPLARHPDYGVVAVLQTSQSASLAPYRSLRDQLVKLSGGALFLSMLAGLLYGRGIARPVVALAGAARRVATGDYSVPVPGAGPDEIGELARAFQHMQVGIAEREKRIVHQGLHDALTGLPNRVRVREMLERAISRASGEGDRPLAVLMLDLDRFKEINDALGHGVGDGVLREVAARLAAALRPGDAVSRLGGDEFLVFLDATAEAGALARGHELAASVREPMEIDGMHISMGASVGLAMFPEHGRDAETLLRRADGAMYDAKSRHCDVAVYQSGHDEQHLRRLGIIRDLQQAIDSGGLCVYYQPKVAMRSAEHVQLEALLRWNHPLRGFVSPAEFVPLAERSGTITRLTRWVLGTVVRQLASWSARGLDLDVSVNVSALDLHDEGLPSFLMSELDRAGIPPQRLTLELTEGAVMKDVDYALRVLQRLRDCGVHLAIDDFGTGYSSLAQLKRLPVDELKIDKSFVLNLRRGSEDEAIVRATIDLAHNLGLKVVAEGVEDATGWSILDACRCDMAQGFLIARPMPAELVPGWLDDHRKQEEGEDGEGDAA